MPVRKLAVIHPVRESRVERASNELLDLRKQISELEERKKELADRLLAWVKQDGEADLDGKVRYETTAHKFIVIHGKNTYISEKKLKAAMAARGMTPKEIERCLTPATTVTEYDYVGVYERKAEEDEEQEEKGA